VENAGDLNLHLVSVQQCRFVDDAKVVAAGAQTYELPAEDPILQYQFPLREGQTSTHGQAEELLLEFHINLNLKLCGNGIFPSYMNSIDFRTIRILNPRKRHSFGLFSCRWGGVG
jgi:hypothetical protein